MSYTNLKYSLSKIVNSRCDDLKNIHEGKHVLFMGDSFAAGDGLEMEDTWCYKVYNKMLKNESLSGYFNIGISGSSISESIDQFFKYCYLYGNPEVVFFITTELHRELRMVKQEMVDEFISKMYIALEQYCRSNNIELYSFSWIKPIDEILPSPERYLWNNGQGEIFIRPLWTEQSKYPHGGKFNQDLLKKFETFYDYTSDQMIEKVFEFDIISKTPEKSLWANDKCHPGTSFHEFYADFILDKYNANRL
jgi:hypothetical protein